MNAREFFWLTVQMRQAQRDYFRTRDMKDLRRARALEGDIDREINRVRDILEQKE